MVRFPVNTAARSRFADLRRLTPFRDCTNAELQIVDKYMTRIDVPDGRILVREGARGYEALFIVDGLARVEREGDEVALLGPGEVVGEMALLERAPRNATVTAVTPLRLYVVDSREFAAILDNVPGVRRWIEDKAEQRRQQNAA